MKKRTTFAYHRSSNGWKIVAILKEDQMKYIHIDTKETIKEAKEASTEWIKRRTTECLTNEI
jgi:hypothetical protein